MADAIAADVITVHPFAVCRNRRGPAYLSHAVRQRVSWIPVYISASGMVRLGIARGSASEFQSAGPAMRFFCRRMRGERNGTQRRSRCYRTLIGRRPGIEEWTRDDIEASLDFPAQGCVPDGDGAGGLGGLSDARGQGTRRQAPYERRGELSKLSERGAAMFGVPALPAGAERLPARGRGHQSERMVRDVGR